jgi:putative intracellular protease/amidase
LAHNQTLIARVLWNYDQSRPMAALCQGPAQLLWAQAAALQARSSVVECSK